MLGNTKTSTAFDTIPVVDCGSQYSHQIVRALRRSHTYSELVPSDITAEEIKNSGAKGVIISGGPSSVYDENSPKLDPEILYLGIPVLGICWGHQWIAYTLGGNVKAGNGEYGHAKIRRRGENSLLKGLGPEEAVWMSHGDSVLSLPDGFNVLAISDSNITAYGDDERKIYGIQFHPEVAHTKKGMQIFENFIGICGCRSNWTTGNYVQKMIDEIKSKAGNEKILMAFSGGIDSATTAILGLIAVGQNLIPVYIDNGFMRDGETEEIIATYRNSLNLRIVEAGHDFYQQLRGVRDPERKRNITGDVFDRILERIALEEGCRFFGQGTLYPDWIESGSSIHSSKIKTHHNVGAERIRERRERGELIEPLRLLYKDDVRELALELGLPEHVIWRQPFPGPGLAVRIEGPVTRERIGIVRHADRIVREEVEGAIDDPRKRPYQYFAILPRSRTTGIKGDARAYGYVVNVRMVSSIEAMTADFERPEWSMLERISTRITNEIPEVTRVTYDITSKPPATIEWE